MSHLQSKTDADNATAAETEKERKRRESHRTNSKPIFQDVHFKQHKESVLSREGIPDKEFRLDLIT